jgi:hypothetical protein
MGRGEWREGPPRIDESGDGVLIGIILRCEEEYGTGCCRACFSLDGSHIGRASNGYLNMDFGWHRDGFLLLLSL